jgi:glutamate-1-semialdehyde 2,1-aminomutase
MTNQASLSTNVETVYRERFPKSAERFEEALTLFPNGVTHDGRYLKPFPVYVDRAAGSKKWTVEGHELIDYWMGHGSLLLGHSHPDVVHAVQEQVAKGTHYGACHELELEWGRLVIDLVPSGERLRFTSSGTEATLMALRLARIATGREKVLKFAGHFHGWHDQLIPGAEIPTPSGSWNQPGITNSVHDDLVIVPPNEIEAVTKAIEEYRPACVILEPTGSRWGTVLIRGEFLRQLRAVTQETGTLLIFDEVITGFRASPGGVQEAYGVIPDLTSLAKIVAGGLPGGCLTGRADILDYIAYENPHGKKMKHPGTYNANPLSAAAGIAALRQVATGVPCEQANLRAQQFRRGLNELFAEKSVDWVAYGDFSITKILPNYTGDRPVDDSFLPYDNDYHLIERPIDSNLSHAFRCALLVNGIDMMGWGAMMSAAHTEDDIEQSVEAFSNAVDLLREDGLIS